jgi:hypothetical protein
MTDIGAMFVNFKFFHVCYLNETFLTECAALTLPNLFVFSLVFIIVIIAKSFLMFLVLRLFLSTFTVCASNLDCLFHQS